LNTFAAAMSKSRLRLRLINKERPIPGRAKQKD
jgi:hypothetical protein